MSRDMATHSAEKNMPWPSMHAHGLHTQWQEAQGLVSRWLCSYLVVLGKVKLETNQEGASEVTRYPRIFLLLPSYALNPTRCMQ
jgi:hypothetical protein